MGAGLFQGRFSLVHGMSVSSSGSPPFGAGHGLISATLTPYVPACGRPASKVALIHLSRRLGLSWPRLDGVLGRVSNLRRSIGIQSTLGDPGLSIDAAEEVRVLPAADVCSAPNPMPPYIAIPAAIHRNAVQGRIEMD